MLKEQPDLDPSGQTIEKSESAEQKRERAIVIAREIEADPGSSPEHKLIASSYLINLERERSLEGTAKEIKAAIQKMDELIEKYKTKQ